MAKKKKGAGGITKEIPKPWILPFTVTVEEGMVFVVRRVLGGVNYEVWPMGVHFYLPRLFHDPVAQVPVVPFHLDRGPFPLTVKNGQQVQLDVKFQCAVGTVNWNDIEVEVDWARANGVWSREVADYDRLPAVEQGRRGGFMRVHHPLDPIDRVNPYLVTDDSIIRAAVAAKDVAGEVETALRSALFEAAMALGIRDVEPTEVGEWLSREPVPVNPSRLPIARRGQDNRQELMEQVVVMAAQSLDRFGLVLFDLRIQGVIIPASIQEAANRRQIAAQNRAAAEDEGAAFAAQMTGLATARPTGLEGILYPLVQMKVAELQAAREGVDVPSISKAIGAAFGTAKSSPGGGGGKGPGGRKPGGSGAPKKKR